MLREARGQERVQDSRAWCVGKEKDILQRDQEIESRATGKQREAQRFRRRPRIGPV